MRPQVSVKVLSPTFASRPLVAYRQANFYRATLCVSAVFAVARCLSVRLSRRWITIQIAEDIVKLLSRPGSAIILVCVPERRYPIPSGTPSAGTQKYTRGILRFSTESPFISETVRDRPMVAMER